MPDDFPRPDHPQPCRIGAIDLHVAARLKRRRLQLQLEPQLIDLAIGEPSGTIERVERGDKRLGASQLYNLAVTLGIGVSYFFADDVDDDDRGATELPVTDHKALSEAKRFARAIARIRSPEIKHMIADLLKSLVTSKEIPAITPPAPDDASGDDAPEHPVNDGSHAGGPSPCEKAPCEKASNGSPREHWHQGDKTGPEHKRAP